MSRLTLPLHLPYAKRVALRAKLGLSVVLCCLAGCLGLPQAVEPVDDFEINRYVGKWYEIARLDHRFERGLSEVTAHYSLRNDGSLAVTNRGYSTETAEWKEATGKAYFVNKDDQGYLKVSFFGPFYGSYVVFELDKANYRYAFVSGPSTEYLWLLSRTPAVEPELIKRFESTAQSLGFDINKLIYVEHANVTQ